MDLTDNVIEEVQQKKGLIASFLNTLPEKALNLGFRIGLALIFFFIGVQLIQLIRKINESGVTILLIEHIMKAVVSLCEKVIVLHHSEKIAEGTPEQVMNDPYVMEVYLGTKKEGASA